MIELEIVNKNILKITGTPEQADKYKYAINVIQYKNSDSEDPEILKTFIVDNAEENECQYVLPKDGYYIIEHILTPSQGKETTYYTDGTHIYKKDSGVVDVKELIEVNDPYLTKYEKETFAICYLHECFLQMCNNKFKQMSTNKCYKANSEDFNLDLIGLSLNAIRYNLEFGYINNAQTIIEDLNRCVNLCKINHKNNECGCCN